MNEARQRRDQLQARIRASRVNVKYDPALLESSGNIQLFIFGKASGTVLVSGVVPASGIVKKLHDMQKNGFWTKQNGSAGWVPPNSIGEVMFYPTPTFFEGPFPELKAPPSSDSYIKPPPLSKYL